MSGVSPTSDVGSVYNYYSKALRDLDQQSKESEQRVKKQANEEIQKLEKDYNKNIQQKEAQANETVERIRADADQAHIRDQEKHHQALEEMKQKRTREIQEQILEENSDHSYKKAYNELSAEHASEQKQHKAEREKDINEIENRYQASHLANEKETAETVKNLRNKTDEVLTQSKEAYKNELEKIKNSTYNNRGHFTGISPEIYKKEVDNLKEQAKTQHQADLQHIEDYSKDIEHHVAEMNHKQEDTIQKLTNTHRDQAKELGEQTRAQQMGLMEERKRQSEMNSDWMKKEERSSRLEDKRRDANYERTLDKLKQDLGTQDKYHEDLVSKIVRERDTKFANQQRQTIEENYSTLKDLENTHAQQVDQMNNQKKQIQKTADDNLSQAMVRASEDREAALGNQAKSYQNTIQNIRSSDESEIHNLQKEINKRNTSPDPSYVSPSAEARIRGNLIQEYQKVLSTEQEKNKLANDQLGRKYGEFYSKAIDDHADKETRMRMENALQQHIDRSQFIDSIQDMELQMKEKTNRDEVSHERERELLYRQFGALYERQKRDYENILAATKAEATDRIFSARQEGVTKVQEVQRAFTFRQNDLVRDYEKRLADQKSDYEYKIDDLKTQTNNEIREVERRSKQELELQAKEYERKMAQLEAQSKERERFVSQNYQDELDKTRRSYELSKKKKS